jgi:hypothetical protein
MTEEVMGDEAGCEMKTGIYFLRTIQAHIQYIQFVCLHI